MAIKKKSALKLDRESRSYLENFQEATDEIYISNIKIKLKVYFAQQAEDEKLAKQYLKEIAGDEPSLHKDNAEEIKTFLNKNKLHIEALIDIFKNIYGEDDSYDDSPINSNALRSCFDNLYNDEIQVQVRFQAFKFLQSTLINVLPTSYEDYFNEEIVPTPTRDEVYSRYEDYCSEQLVPIQIASHQDEEESSDNSGGYFSYEEGNTGFPDRKDGDAGFPSGETNLSELPDFGEDSQDFLYLRAALLFLRANNPSRMSSSSSSFPRSRNSIFSSHGEDNSSSSFGYSCSLNERDG